MAALLRSARLLRFSPSGLLHITGTKRNGPPLGRLYSGALGGRLRVWPCAAGCARSYATATEQKNESSAMLRSKQSQQFDWALAKLDSSVRRTGRITKTFLLRIFHDICRTGRPPDSNQALLLLRSCGLLLPEVPLEERTELAHRVWEKLKELGAQYDVSHYNALLKVYLQNEFKFSPNDFLAKMEAANVQPNRVTYQRLIAAYCQNGDIEGASTILGFMKSKDLPITEAVFNSLVTGHARAGDIKSAENILPVMRGAGIEPGPDTYISLLNAHAEKGDLDSLKKTMEAAESADASLMDRDVMQVIFTLAKAGHQQHIPDMVERLRHERGYVPDAMNLCLSLITQGLEDTAFNILKTFPTLQSESFNTDAANLGNFFLRHCVDMDTSLEKIGEFCKELQESNLHTSALTFTLSCALEAKKTALSLKLMKLIKEQDLPIRPHYFWPLLTQHVKDGNTAGVVEVLKGMQELEVSPDVETLTTYVLPVFPSMEAARQTLQVTHDTQHKSVLNNRCMFVFIHVFIFLLSQITELLYKDERFSAGNSTASEAADFFLYNLINSMSEGEVQAQEDKLRKYFNQLQAQNIIISRNIYRGIKNLLDTYNVPELIKGTENSAFVQKRLAELKAENKPLGATLKQAIHALCAEENLQRALELKQEHEEEMTAGGYANLINLCCRHDNVEEALNLKREMSRKDSSVTLDASKYIVLVKTLSKNGRVDEAVDILKEMKEKEVALNDSHLTMLFFTLSAVDTIFTLGLAKPTSNLCSPLITAYLESKDLSGALEAALECQKLYSHLPRIHDIIVALMEKGDTELLQRAMDFVSQERGEMTMLYDLFFGFLQTGRYREARKIVETPGLRARPGRLNWYAEKCISSNQMEALEQMADMTDKLFECDRDEMYSYVLRLCSESLSLFRSYVCAFFLFSHSSTEALEKLKSMMQKNYVPSQLAITRLVQALGNHGDVAGVQEVESLVHSLGGSLNLSSMVFVNNTALAHIKNGDVDSAVEVLEAVFTSPDSTNPSISFVFRKVLEDDNDKALDKLSAMAERLANHFACYRPASDLFLRLLDMDKVEDAKFMLAIKALLSLIPDFTEKEVLYPYLMKCHVLDKDLSSAKALHEQMQEEGIVTDELSLKRLAGLYRDAGETAPFTEPPVSVYTHTHTHTPY
uniref:Leucine rich pentatricopeptide repeat containing n=1 Tax=Gasterosteus aculeatus aculeatus TaxID=481459 RepID=G3P982_GASAC